MERCQDQARSPQVSISIHHKWINENINWPLLHVSEGWWKSYLLTDLLLHPDGWSQLSHLSDPFTGIAPIFPQNIASGVGRPNQSRPMVGSSWNPEGQGLVRKMCFKETDRTGAHFNSIQMCVTLSLNTIIIRENGPSHYANLHFFSHILKSWLCWCS